MGTAVPLFSCANTTNAIVEQFSCVHYNHILCQHGLPSGLSTIPCLCKHSTVDLQEYSPKASWLDEHYRGTHSKPCIFSLAPVVCLNPLPMPVIEDEVKGKKCYCLLGLYACTGGHWSEEAVEDLARLTLCALWRVVMVRLCGEEDGELTVNIVDTTTNKVEAACT